VLLFTNKDTILQDIMAKRKPKRNRINELMRWDATDDLTPVSIIDGLDAACNWELPPAYVCIVRAVYPDGTLIERAYKNGKAAKRFMMETIANDGDFTILTDNVLQDTYGIDHYGTY
tara:strand:+ start:380 stop:730 length:351 start_codon:yes stop_codon:yes gene_type:complete